MQTKRRGSEGRTFPTKSCVRVSRGGFVARGDAEDAMAIWMTASMSSFVGPEPAGCGFEGVAAGDEAGQELSPADEDEGRVEERAGGACG